MLRFWDDLFLFGQYIPHGHCYLWQSPLVGLHVSSDAVIALSYFSIPAMLVYFVRQRQDIPFTWIFWMFGAFITSCGLSHLMGIWTLWHPDYWLSGGVKVITAIVSCYTALELFPLIPQALALPSPAQLEITNQKLADEIQERKQAEAEILRLNQALEDRVAQRTTELQLANQQKEELLRREQEARQHLEAAIAEVKDYSERLTLALDAAQMGLWDWDLLTARVFWTAQHEQLFDYAPGTSERFYEDWANRVHPEDLPRAEQAIQEALSQQQDYACQYRIIWSDGSVRWIDSFGRCYANTEGQPMRLLGMSRDITDRKLIEDERRQAALQLQQQAEALTQLNQSLAQSKLLLEQRNQELNQFAYIVSHDLKAPLRAIANLSEWMEEDLQGQLPPENQQQMQLMRSRVHRMEGLINGLLEYSRIGRVETSVESVSVGRLLAEILDSLDPPKTFTVAIAPNMPTCLTKRIPLSQVFSNLISNAIKHHDRPEGNIQITVSDLGSAYEFAVSDDGPGIPVEFHDQVFAIFKTLKSRDSSENSGVGLSIVKKIVETEGGTIRLESQVGQGTTFRFTWLKSLP